ncbi:M42 family metallopeptidase [Paenibacillus pinistramenti]|uniref:M42 family metallopeptidase n=1 Tax=Paenibacillus pinistramenti TaxID=1768003 RepID=UPI003B835AB5
MNVNEQYVITFLKQLLDTPSPSGYTHHIIEMIEQEADKLGIPFERNAKGGAILRLKGADSSNPLCLSAHVDTLGAIVRSVTPRGTLAITSVGGFMMQSIENEYCRIHTRGGKVYTGTIMSTHPSVHVYSDAREFPRVEKNMEVRIDELVNSKDDVLKLGIQNGDFISFDARAVVTDSGFVKSRHIDDKASVAALFGLLEAASSGSWKPRREVVMLISNYEEVGHGAACIPEGIEEMIAVDMGCIGEDLACKETDVSICAKDSSGPYDYHMTSKLIELAKQENIPYAVDIYPQYGSDASAALRAGHNIRAALIGPGVHASHAMERTTKQAVINTARLLGAYVNA